MRLIDADKLVKTSIDTTDIPINKCLDVVLLEDIESAPTVGEWISCSERLPEENGEYIASLEDAIYPWASFFNGKWFMLSLNGIAREFGEYEVIAWMPLPPVYQGE